MNSDAPKHVQGLGDFCARLGKMRLPAIEDEVAAKRWVLETIEVSAAQYFTPGRLAWINQEQAAKLAEGLSRLIPELGQVKLDFEDYDVRREERGLALRRSKLTALLEAIERALEARAAASQTLEDPAWRIALRPGLEAAVAEKLEASGLLAIVGMSGVGKTWLAGRVFDQMAASSKHRLDAPKPDDPSDLGGEAFGGLISQLFEIVKSFCRNARLPARGDPRRGPIGDNLRQVNSAIAQFLSAQKMIVIDDGGEPSDKAKILIAALEDKALGIGARAGASALAILAILAERRYSSAPKSLILIDDVWPDGPDAVIARRVFAAMSPEVASEGQTHERPWRLLLTSQDRRAASGFNGEPSEGRIAELDDPLEDRRAFGRRVVAAWAMPAPAGPYRSQDEADVEIEAFHAATFAPAAPGRAPIDAVIDLLDGHPLALAALASDWATKDFEPGFWDRAAAALKAGKEDEDWTVSSPLEAAAKHRIVNPRHFEVLRALRFAMGRLAEEDRRRLDDLLVQRPGSGPLRRAVFVYWWRRPAPGRSDTGIDATFAKLTRLSLLQNRRGGMRLHDLMRFALLQDDGPAGLARRHRSLLEAAGLLDRDGLTRNVLTLDEQSDFEWALAEGGEAKLCRLLLRLRPDRGGGASRAEREAISAYMLDEVLHHIDGLEDSIRPPLRQALLTRFAFLQALLDAPGMPANQPG